MKIIIIIIFAIFTVEMVYAYDLGSAGQTYPIAEDDFTLFLQKRLDIMQKNGELKKLENQFRDNVEKHADRPSPLETISRTVQNRAWLFNPAITVPYNLQDAEGHIFAKNGTTINPLNYISLHKVLIFFNGDDIDQIKWTRKANSRLLGRTKLVLVKGSIIENEKRFSQPIYFDQGGRLTTRFHIEHVPAVVQQEGLNLKISEVVP